MTKFIHLLAVCSLLSFNTSTHAQQTAPLKICWESELKPPYLTQDQQGQVRGIAVEWLSEIMTARQLGFENVVMPWKRCLLSLKRGLVDLVPNASFKQKRTEFAYYSPELYRTHLDFYYIKDKHPKAHHFKNIEQLNNYTVGGVNGFNYAFYKDEITIDSGAYNRKALIKKLLRGRVDFAILQREVLASIYQHDRQVLAPLASIPAPGNHFKSFYILIDRNHSQATWLTNEVAAGLKQIKESGIYQQILNKHL